MRPRLVLTVNADLVVRADPMPVVSPLKGKIDGARLRQRGSADFQAVLAETAVFGVPIGGIFPTVDTPMDQRRARQGDDECLPASYPADRRVEAPDGAGSLRPPAAVTPP